jgi:hypothetical protein
MKRKIRIIARKLLRRGERADVSFVPPLARRRLSPLQKAFFHLARFDGAPQPANVVFASRFGEDTLTRKIVEEFNSSGAVSPKDFSASVYNAAPGAWSVFTRSGVPYTAVAAGRDTVRCANIEALGMKRGPVLLVYAEEAGGMRGFSVLFDFVDG